MFKIAAGGLWFEVGERDYGRQDCGISPKGASDQLSFIVARTLLGDPADYRCVEIIAPSAITFTQEVTFCVTGAHYSHLKLNGLEIPPNTIHKALEGDTLTFGTLLHGFRTYLFATASCPVNGIRIGKSRGSYETWFGNIPKRIRVFKGPEYKYLQEPDSFFNRSWNISQNSGRMGIRLDGKQLNATRYDIVSSAVDDGTVQLTSSGPIVLMRERQTTGGYPRVFQMAQVDIDLLAQYPLRAHVAFERIERHEALRLLKERHEQIQRFRNALL
ncbi:MAG: hypothetical protein R3302_08905 [Sulfurimonadaceae bacterium]|nr:hypothetical protein [Sulfurimonadaceae bacterium]